MVATTLAPARRMADTFYIWMAAASVLIAFGGFAPTYWLQLPAGTFTGSPLVHLHGLLFSAWPLLLLLQTVLAAKGRLTRHGAWGLAGIALATAMVVTGPVVAITHLTAQLALGYGDRARAFLIVPLSAIALFGGFVLAAIVNIKRPEAHKRLMLLATIALLQAALGRVAFVLATGGGPGLRPDLGLPPTVSLTMVPSLVAELMIVVGMVRDWQVRGRPHAAWLIGGAVMHATILLRAPLSTTPAWLTVADGLARIAG